MCMNTHVTPGGQKRAYDSLGQKLQVAVNSLTWVLGIELWSSGRKASAPNHGVLSPAPAE